MKIKDTFYILLVVVGFLLVSFSDPIQKKKITDVYYRYEFYTTRKTVEPGRETIAELNAAFMTSESRVVNYKN